MASLLMCPLRTKFLRAGDVSPWSGYQQVWNIGASGFFWSFAVTDGANARYLDFNPASVGPSSGNSRANGFSLRCLVLSSAS